MEQRKVLAYLGRATNKISEAIARARRQIELVEEYRTRLIADVVTGKLDVREAAARLPDEPDDADGTQRPMARRRMSPASLLVPMPYEPGAGRSIL